MEYSRIVAVTGLPGLYEVLSSKADGAIVRSLEDGSTKFIAARVHNLSHLESIEIYTTGHNVSLSEIFDAIKNSGTSLPDVKDNKALKAYFEKVYPELDFERVYTSDMKKMVNWYKVLEQHGIDYTATNEEENAGTDSEADAPAPEAEAKPAAETKAKKTKTAKAKETPAKEEGEEKPKTTRKRKKKEEE